MKNPATMTNAEINKYRARLSEYLSKNTQVFVDMGLGHMRGSDIRKLAQISGYRVYDLSRAPDLANARVSDIHHMKKRGHLMATANAEVAAELTKVGLGHIRCGELIGTWNEARALAERFIELQDDFALINREIEARMGPNWIGELPKGGAREKAA